MIQINFKQLSSEAQSAILFTEVVSIYKPIDKSALISCIETEKERCQRVIERNCCGEHVASAMHRQNELCNLLDFIDKFTLITSDN